MPTTPHSGLTGSDLHEPKGVAAAAASLAYISNGSGSGTWQTIALASLASTAKAFQAQLLHVQDQKSSGTAGGTFTSGDWRTRTLNTSITNEISGASLASNQVTLPAGTYYLEASAPAYQVNLHQLRVRNVTDSATLLTGTIVRSASADNSVLSSGVYGRFTLSGTKAIELQHQCSLSGASDGFGQAGSFGTEVYSDLRVWKIA